MREGRAGEGERDGEEARGRTDRLRRWGRASLVGPWLRLRPPHAGQKKKMASTREGGTEGVAEGPGLKDFCHPPPGARGLPRWRWR